MGFLYRAFRVLFGCMSASIGSFPPPAIALLSGRKSFVILSPFEFYACSGMLLTMVLSRGLGSAVHLLTLALIHPVLALALSVMSVVIFGRNL